MHYIKSKNFTCIIIIRAENYKYFFNLSKEKKMSASLDCKICFEKFDRIKHKPFILLTCGNFMFSNRS